MALRYEDIAPKMDAQVSDRLGVSISYAASSGGYTEIRGFVIDTDPGDDTAAIAIDELPERKRMKIDLVEIAKATGRMKPSVHDRIICPRLGDGVWRPGSKKPRNTGRSVIFDVVRSNATS
jgi:hypothetical protein